MSARIVVLLTLLSGCSSCGSSAPAHESTGAPAASGPASPNGPAELFAEPPPLAHVAPPNANQAALFTPASNAFAVDLYQRVRGEPGNLFFSPASIEIALAMTTAGARGETAEQMSRVLHIEGDAAAFHDAAARMLTSWNDASGAEYELHVANRLFGERSYRFEAPFLTLVRESYRAPLEPLDFRNGADASAHHINSWVASQTGGHIERLFEPGALTSLTRLVLVNAVYFLGKWASPFGESETHDRTFYVGGTDAHDVPTMHLDHELFYGEDDEVQVLEMPYVGDRLSMTIILPRARDGLGAVEASLDPESLYRRYTYVGRREVDAYVPRFTIRGAGLALAPVLREMGMPLAFDENAADFTGIVRRTASTPGIVLDSVVHEAFVEVNEEGTEAAAATAVVAELAGAEPSEPPPPVEVRADHPFLFLIRDTRTGAILFLGRLEQP